MLVSFIVKRMKKQSFIPRQENLQMLLFEVETRPLLHDPLEQPTSMVSIVSVISINKTYNHTVRLIMFTKINFNNISVNQHL